MCGKGSGEVELGLGPDVWGAASGLAGLGMTVRTRLFLSDIGLLSSTGFRCCGDCVCVCVGGGGGTEICKINLHQVSVQWGGANPIHPCFLVF